MASGRRAVATTTSPAATAASTIARPKPLDAPVTSHTRRYSGHRTSPRCVCHPPSRRAAVSSKTCCDNHWHGRAPAGPALLRHGRRAPALHACRRDALPQPAGALQADPRARSAAARDLFVRDRRDRRAHAGRGGAPAEGPGGLAAWAMRSTARLDGRAASARRSSASHRSGPRPSTRRSRPPAGGAPRVRLRRAPDRLGRPDRWARRRGATAPTPPSSGCRYPTPPTTGSRSPPSHGWSRCPHHRLASRDLAIADLLDEPFLALPAEAGPLRDYWLALDARADRHPCSVAEIATTEETVEALTAGLGVCLVAAGNVPLIARDGVVVRSVTGARTEPPGSRLEPRRRPPAAHPAARGRPGGPSSVSSRCRASRLIAPVIGTPQSGISAIGVFSRVPSASPRTVNVRPVPTATTKSPAQQVECEVGPHLRTCCQPRARRVSTTGAARPAIRSPHAAFVTKGGGSKPPEPRAKKAVAAGTRQTLNQVRWARSTCSHDRRW